MSREVFTVTRSERFRRDFALVDQMRRATTSIMSNIAEGFERDSIAERLHFYAIAKASCAELRSQLYIALDADLLDQQSFDALQARAERAGRLLGGLRASIGKIAKSTNGSG